MADGTVTISIDVDDKGAVKSVNGVEQSLGGLGDKAQKATVSIGSMLKTLGLAKIAKAGIDMVKSSIDGAISRYDVLNNSEKVFENMGFEAEESSAMMDNLLDSIKGLPTPLEEAVQGVQGIAAANGDLDKSEKIYSALNNSILGVGKSGEEVNSAVEMLTRGINSGKISGQEFNTLMQTMGPNLQAVAKDMGMTTGELQKGLSDGSVSVEEFTDKLIEMDTEGGGGMASFQKQARDMTAGIGTAMANAKTAVVRSVANIIGAIDDGLQAVNLPTIGEMINQFGDKVSEVFGRIAEAIPPIIKRAVELYNAIEPWLPLIGAVAGAVAGMVAAWSAFNKVKSIIEGVKTSFALLTTILSANPWVIAVGAAIAAAVLIYTYWDEIKEFFSNLWEWLKETGATVWDNVVTKWTETVEILTTLWDGIKEFFSELWEGIKEVALAIWEPIQTKWTETVETFSELWTGIKEFFSEIWEGVKEVALAVWEPIQERWNEVKEYFAEVWTETVEYFKELWSDVTQFFSEVWMEVTEIFTEVWTGIKEFFSEIWEGIKEIALIIWEPIQAKWNEVVEFLKETWSSIKEFFSGLWEGVKEITLAIWEGIKAVLVGVWEFIKTTAIAVFEFIKGNITEKWNAIKTITTTVWNGIKAVLTSVWNLIKVTVETAINVVKTVVQAGWDIIKALTVGTWNAIKTAISTAWTNIKTVIDTTMTVIKTVITTIWNAIKGVITAVLALIRGDVSGAFNAIKGVISTVMNGIRSVITTVWNGIKSVVSTTVNAIRSTISSVFNSLKGIVSGAFNGVKSAIKSGLTGGLNIVKNMGTQFKNAGRKIVSMLADGIKSAASKVTNAASNLMGKVRDFLPFSPAKVGPLTDIDRLNFGGPIETSIEHAVPKVRGSLNSLLDIPDVTAGNIEMARRKGSNFAEAGVTTNNDNGVTLTIENIENHSDSDIPKILEEAAWIIEGKKRGELNG